MEGKNCLGSNAWDYTCDNLKVFHKSHQLSYLPKNLMHYSSFICGVFSIFCKGFGIVSLNIYGAAKMKYHTSENLGPTFYNPLDDVKLCAILLHVVL